MSRSRRAGFTLVEIVVAMTLTLAVFAITLPFLRVQTRALGASAGRLDADQVARYAQRAIDRDLRLAASDPGQPLLVMAGPRAIAFNANLTAPDTSDPGAAEIEVGAATTLTESWRLANAAALPVTGRSYPPADYTTATGAISRHETISYFLHPDTISGRSDLYVLYRRVNARDSVQIVRSIHVPADSDFFSYFRPVAGTLTRIAASRLPLYWDSTAIDSVRAVGLRSAGYYRNRTTGEESIRTVHWRTVLPNSRARLAGGCGVAPAPPTAVDRTKASSSSGYRVRVSWDGAADDGGGANDIVHYLVGVRYDTETVWRVLAAVPARGAPTYRWDHHLPTLAGSVKYGVRSVDCGGALSAWATHTSTLTLP